MILPLYPAGAVSDDVLGYAPDVRLQEGLRLTWDWFQNRERPESELAGVVAGAPSGGSASTA